MDTQESDPADDASQATTSTRRPKKRQLSDLCNVENEPMDEPSINDPINAPKRTNDRGGRGGRSGQSKGGRGGRGGRGGKGKGKGGKK